MTIETRTTQDGARTVPGRVLIAGFIAGPVATEIIGRVLKPLVDQPARGWMQLGAAAAGIACLIARRVTRWFGIAAAAGVVAIFGVGYLLAWWFADSINSSL
jgi:hypothetical protein